MGEVIQLQGDQRKDVQEFLVDKKEGLELDAKTIKVSLPQLSMNFLSKLIVPLRSMGFRVLTPAPQSNPHQWTFRIPIGKLQSR